MLRERRAWRESGAAFVLHVNFGPLSSENDGTVVPTMGLRHFLSEGFDMAVHPGVCARRAARYPR
jgi:hypothetical protein